MFKIHHFLNISSRSPGTNFSSRFKSSKNINPVKVVKSKKTTTTTKSSKKQNLSIAKSTKIPSWFLNCTTIFLRSSRNSTNIFNSLGKGKLPFSMSKLFFHQTQKAGFRLPFPFPRVQKPFLKIGVVGLVGFGGIYYNFGLSAQDRRLISLNASGILRFLRTTTTGLGIGFDYWYSLKRLHESQPNYFDELNKIHTRNATRLLDLCLKNGGIYVKLGQGLVSLSHVLPKPYIEELKTLQDQCLHRNDKTEIEQIFIEDFGKSYKDIFEDFDEVPIAAASLAQVYQGTSKAGEKVAIKVQYIDLRDRFHSDIWTIETLLKFIQIIHPNFGFSWILKDLKETLAQELDFLNEGKNSERCAKELEHLGYIYVPKVYWELCSQRILTAEFIDGIKVSDKVKLQENNLSLTDVDTKLINAFSEQIFHTGFVHADPHPGNVLVRKHQGSAQLVLLDHGLYEFLPEPVRMSLCKLWKAIVLDDYDGMKMFSTQLGVSEYRMFCMFVSLRYIPEPGSKSRSNEFLTKVGPKIAEEAYAKMSPNERRQMESRYQEAFDKLNSCMTQIPSQLILVLRNINTIRSITADHGTGIDRYSLMARSATKGQFISTKSNKSAEFHGIMEQFLFDFKIYSHKIKVQIVRQLVNFLWLIGFRINME